VIPVTVLTGFLGSGKTTLLGHLLRQPDLARTAVIINEFGEIGLDHELVEASDDSTIALTTGCLCCKVRDDLTATLGDLIRRRDEGTVAPFTRVVIETSGLADPAPILQTLMTDRGLAERLMLGGVVTTVDAVNGATTLAREAISAKQVAVADRLVLTKSDLAEAEDRTLLARLAALNPSAPLLHADRGMIDPRGILEARSLDQLTRLPEAEQGGERHHHHDNGIVTYAIVRAAPIRAVTLTLLLETLAEHCGSDLLRLKGIVNVAESPQQPAVIHGVQHVFHPPSWLPHWPTSDRRSRIVVIARGVPRHWLEALIDALDAEVAEVSAGR
jgi:G3E family GTPase